MEGSVFIDVMGTWPSPEDTGVSEIPTTSASRLPLLNLQSPTVSTAVLSSAVRSGKAGSSEEIETSPHELTSIPESRWLSLVYRVKLAKRERLSCALVAFR